MASLRRPGESIASSRGLIDAPSKRTDYRKAYILLGGLPNLTDLSGSWAFLDARQYSAPRCAQAMTDIHEPLRIDGDDSFSKEVRREYSTEQIRQYSEVIGPLKPEDFVRHAAPAKIYFQFARWDRYITRAFADRYEAAASTTKISRTYDTSHEFNDFESWRDRTAWIFSELKLKRPSVFADCQGSPQRPRR